MRYIGFIFIIMPISFAVFLETDYEIQKMMKSTQSIKNLNYFELI